MVRSIEGGSHPKCVACGGRIDNNYNSVLRREGLYHADCHADKYGPESALDDKHFAEEFEPQALAELERDERRQRLSRWAKHDRLPPNNHGGRRVA